MQMRIQILALVMVSVLGLLVVPAWAQPINDDCAAALDVSEGQFDFDLSGANNSVQSSCDDPNAGPVPDMWYRYTASGHGSAIITTCGLVSSFFGTTITVYNNCGGN